MLYYEKFQRVREVKIIVKQTSIVLPHIFSNCEYFVFLLYLAIYLPINLSINVAETFQRKLETV